MTFGCVGWHMASNAGLNPQFAFAAAVAAWLAIVSLVLGMLRLQLPGRTRRRFSEERSLHGEVRLSWSEDHLTFETSNGHSRHSWDEFGKWAESKAVFIVFYTERLFSFVPKRVLSSNEVEELRELLARR